MSDKVKKIICVVGLPGSGKTTATSIIKSLNIPVLVMGDVVREEARKRGLPTDLNTLMSIAKELREREGPAAIALRIAEKIKSINRNMIAIDGARSFHEIEVFKKMGNVYIMAIHASPRTRFKRLFKRGRPDDPKSLKELRKRDLTELSFGLGSLIALADYMIINEKDIKHLKDEILRVINEVIKDP